MPERRSQGKHRRCSCEIVRLHHRPASVEPHRHTRSYGDSDGGLRRRNARAQGLAREPLARQRSALAHRARASAQSRGWGMQYYFHAAAMEGTVTAAAQSLGVTTATVSEQLRALERALGKELFERTQTGLKRLSGSRRCRTRGTTALPRGPAARARGTGTVRPCRSSRLGDPTRNPRTGSARREGRARSPPRARSRAPGRPCGARNG